LELNSELEFPFIGARANNSQLKVEVFMQFLESLKSFECFSWGWQH